jgi:hypothetical protein
VRRSTLDHVRDVALLGSGMMGGYFFNDVLVRQPMPPEPWFDGIGALLCLIVVAAISTYQERQL